MKNSELPKISITTATYCGENILEDFLEKIFSQDYPLDKMEIILGDGGSKDKTLEIINKYKKKYPKNIKFFHNKKQFSEGKGMCKDQMTQMAKGEILVILDQDNLLIQKNWIKRAVEVLINNKNIKGVQSRMVASKNSSNIDKYLNDLGIEDPFACLYSLNAQITLNPKKFKFNKKSQFYIYRGDVNNFFYAGGDGFVIRKKDLMNAGGYTQDIDNFYRMAKKHYEIAVPKEMKFHHKTSTEFWPYIKKRIFFVQHYLANNNEERDFYWIRRKNSFKQNLKFIKSIIYNFLMIPNIYQGIKMSVKSRKISWMFHGFVPFIITGGYIYSFIYNKMFGKIGVKY